MTRAILFGVMILGISLIGITVQDAHAAAFIKYDGIDGESQDKSHKDWINLLSFDFNSDNFFSIKVQQPIDKSTPKLAEAACKGKALEAEPPIDSTSTSDETEPGPIPICATSTTSDSDRVNDPLPLPIRTVTINFCKNLQGPVPQCYLEWKMTNVMITSFQISGATSGDQVPTEQLSLNFEEINVKYTEYDDKGKQKGNVEYSWKVEEGES